MHTIYNNLTNVEFLRIAAQEIDNPGVADVMPVVAELFTRYAALVEVQEQADEFSALLDEFSVTAEHVRGVLEVANDFTTNIDVIALRKKLECADEFTEIAQEGHDILQRLEKLATRCQ